jgi:hypothetical protein
MFVYPQSCDIKEVEVKEVSLFLYSLLALQSPAIFFCFCLQAIDIMDHVPRWWIIPLFFSLCFSG